MSKIKEKIPSRKIESDLYVDYPPKERKVKIYY